MTLRRIFRSPGLAAVLSFFVPGLGQAVQGAYRRGFLIALPTIGLVIWALAVGPKEIEHLFLRDHNFLVTVLVLDVATLVYHLWAVVDAYRVAQARSAATPAGIRTEPVARARRASPGLATAGLGVLLIVVLATVGTHGFVAYTDVNAYDAIAKITNPNGPDWIATVPPNYTLPPEPSDYGDDYGPSPSPTNGASPTPTPNPDMTFSTDYPFGGLPESVDLNTNWRADGKLNVLLAGVDQGCTAGSGNRMFGLRPDTMILLEVDIATGRSAMYGIPRNLTNVPLPRESAKYYSGGGYPGMLNALWLEAVNHPNRFPYYQNNSYMRGIKAMEGAIGALTGLRVDGTVLVNLMGFVYIVDSMHGLDINIKDHFVDHPDPPRYSGYQSPDCSGHVSYDWKPGPRHLNGFDALAYARARGQTWDYTRMERQQLVLKAIRDKVNPCSLSLGDVNGLISALGQAFWTDMPQPDLPDFIRLAGRVGSGNVASFTFAPYNIGTKDNTLTTTGWANVKYMVAHGLSKVPTAPASGTGGGYCG